MSSSPIFASLGAAFHNLSTSPIFSGFKSPPAPPPNPALASFYETLATQLRDLIQTSSSSYLCIPWLCQAMQLVLSAHSIAESFLPELQQALSHGDTKWLYHYLDDNLKLLDVFNAIKDSIREIRTFQKHLDLSMRALNKSFISSAQLRRAKASLHKCTELLLKKKNNTEESNANRRCSIKLEKCSSMLRRMGERLNSNSEDASKGNFFIVSYAAQVITIFLCGALTATLSMKHGRPLATISIDGQTSWASNLTSLQHRLKEQLDRKKARGSSLLLEELCTAHTVLLPLQEKVESLLNSKSFLLSSDDVSELRQLTAALTDASSALSSSLGSLESNVDAVSKVLITSRMVLLDMYSRI